MRPSAAPAVHPADKEVLRANPDDPAAHNNLGNSLMGLKRYPEAVASYSRAVELAPQFSFAQCNRAIALFAGARRGRGGELSGQHALALVLRLFCTALGC